MRDWTTDYVRPTTHGGAYVPCGICAGAGTLAPGWDCDCCDDGELPAICDHCDTEHEPGTLVCLDDTVIQGERVRVYCPPCATGMYGLTLSYLSEPDARGRRRYALHWRTYDGQWRGQVFLRDPRADAEIAERITYDVGEVA